MAMDFTPLGVLLVEDNPGDADLVREWLDQEDVYRFRLSPVTTLQQAQSALQSDFYDAVLLDLSLPDSQGIETLTLLRESCQTIPILVFSGSSSDENRLAAYRAGAQDFIPKSEDAGQLLARAILYAVERYRTQSQQHYLERVMAANPDAVLVIDSGGTVQFVNEAAAGLFSRSREDLVGRPLDIDLSAGALKEIEIVRGREPRVGEVRVASVEWLRKPAMLVTIRDRTDYKRIEEQLRQSQKMEAIGRLAGGVAHDFNNLLTVINGYVEVLIDDLELSPEQLEMLECVQQAGSRGAALTSQLLAFGRRSIVKASHVDLNAILLRLEVFLRRLIGEDIDLDVLLAGDTGQILADPTHVEQIIMNLAVNARDAMRRGGRLVIETEHIDLDEHYVMNRGDSERLQPGAYVRLSISDTGIGMDQSIMSKIFEPFFTTKEPGQGTGLGLATVYGIVRQMNGHITCYSEVDMGTRFSVYLPAAAGLAPVENGADAPDPVTCRGAETVLLVEDDAEVRQLIHRALASYGYQVLEAITGQHAVELAREHEGPIHLLVTDVIMPRIGGADLAGLIKPVHPETRVLYISGYTNDAIIRHGIMTANVNFLQKPFTPAGLAVKVRHVLDAREVH